MNTLAPPSPMTPTIGRDGELVRLAAMLDSPEARLVTLTGPPGVGKSRLVIALMRSRAQSCCYLDLRAADLTAVPESELPTSGCLVLDNADGVDLVGPWVSELLTGRRDLTAVVTSRSPLDAYGQNEFTVDPLPVADQHTEQPPEELWNLSSSRLFVSRCRAIGIQLRPDSLVAANIAELCRLLDGLPLAIELASLRMRSLGLDQLLAGVRSSLELLTSDETWRPASQRSLAAAIRWSYERLRKADRDLLCRLSVLSGSISLDAAKALGPSWSERRRSGRTLLTFVTSVERLLSAGLMQRTGDPSHGTVVVLNTVRAFARDELERTGRLDETNRTHAHYYSHVAEEAFASLTTGNQLHALQKLDDPNIERALRWWINDNRDPSAPRHALRLAGAISPLWQLRGGWESGLHTLQACLDRCPEEGDDVVRARALWGASGLSLSLGNLEQAVALLEEAARIYADSDELGVARSLSLLGAVRSRQGDHAAAVELITRALGMLRALDDPIEMALALNNLGLVATARGQHGRAARYFEDALGLLRSSPDRRATAWAMINLGDATWDRGDLPRAAVLYKASLEDGLLLGGQSIVAACLDGLAAVSAMRGGFQMSARLLGAADEIRSRIGAHPPRYRAASRERVQRVVRGQLGDKEYRSLRAAGHDLRLVDAAELARQVQAHDADGRSAHDHPRLRDPVRFSPAVLTAREIEVVHYLARGLTNRQLAGALSIAEGTAARHVENILGKLGLRTRAQITAWAHENDLVGDHPQ